MDLRQHLHLTGEALKRWLIAQTLDAVCVGIFWLVGLWIIGVPWAPLWALLGALFQYIPNFGPVLSLIGPAIAAALSGGGVRFLYVLMLYGILAVLDGLVIQPYLLRRTARVPIWASILAPIVLGMIFSFWGVLVAAPLLAVIYAYRTRNRPPDAPV
ncbi:MAG TPA: AI-2E family transporter [Terriglobales bacterium]|nr:AI-2E family transporter [Terriglobales bacterium]